MIKIGQKVSFVPHFMEAQMFNPRANKPEPVVGTVFMVNPSREMFFVEWYVHGVTMRVGFQFFDLHRKVYPLRSPKDKHPARGDAYG